MSVPEVDPLDDEAIAAAVDLLGDLQRQASREDIPKNLRKLSRYGAEQVSSMLAAARAGNRIGVEEIILGTLCENGKRHPDGLRQVLPRWARGMAVLEALAGVVVVDETQNPVTVTVRWERVPRKLRPAAASLASELVDMYQPRPPGGRGRKTPASNRQKLGDPETGDPRA